ncbi:hypothetical protein Tco_0588822 [Tanacetum coccineum]
MFNFFENHPAAIDVPLKTRSGLAAIHTDTKPHVVCLEQAMSSVGLGGMRCKPPTSVNLIQQVLSIPIASSKVISLRVSIVSSFLSCGSISIVRLEGLLKTALVALSVFDYVSSFKGVP